MISIENYKYESWKVAFPEKVDISSIPIYTKWKDYIDNLNEHKLFKSIENSLTDEVQSGVDIYPYPNLVFNVFNQIELDRIKVVILGQDPYINAELHNGVKIPQAMGVSFSVPIGIRVPPSLDNVFKNQKMNGIIYEKQPHGNLQFWINQGCFMLNTALTVRENDSGSHCAQWKLITDKIIKYISTELNHIVFVLWGNPAYEKLKLIDLDKHSVVISSHPSGLSCNRPMKDYQPFVKLNHFKIINDYLIKYGHDPIIWQLF
jgi:uracil-DNA glycosylase